ncbi:MAG: mandelate racemase/muconate lactonizing enzyme family protein [Acidobacteriota bacterium]
MPTDVLADRIQYAAGISPPKIRISGVRIHSLAGRLQERFGWSLGWTETRTATLVEVTTDAGLTGWGDGACNAALLAQYAGRIIGRSPFEVEAIYEELREPAGPQQRPGPPAAPALDIALWDLAGQALGVPVSALLGRRYRDRVSVYLTALYRKDWPDLAGGLACEARSWVAAGFRALKMKIGYSPETDVKIVRAVREAIGPGIALGVDANCAYDAGTAASLGVRLEPFDLMFFEEPLLADDLDGYRRLRKVLRIPLAAGETAPADWLIVNYVQPRLIDILQPDLEHIGFTGARLLTHLCWLNRIRLIPHNWGTALRTAATLHWMSCCPPLTPALNPPEPKFEFEQTEHPFRDAIIKEQITFNPVDGAVAVPEGPGLGVTVIPEAVEEYRGGLVSIPG